MRPVRNLSARTRLLAVAVLLIVVADQRLLVARIKEWVERLIVRHAQLFGRFNELDKFGKQEIGVRVRKLKGHILLQHHSILPRLEGK